MVVCNVSYCLCPVIVCLFVNYSNALYFTNAVNKSCTTNDEKPGICVERDECNSLSKEEKQKYCAFVNSAPIICCPSSQQTIKEKCEQYAKIRCEKIAQGLVHTIYNGDEVTSIREFPHQIYLGYMSIENPVFYCGGSLITEEWILTAAHCVKSRQGRPLVADMGLLKLTNRNEFGTFQRINITELHPHPLYNASLRYNDIALVKLERPAKLSAAVVPACLYDNSTLSAKSAYATGWGMTQTSEQSDILLKVLLDISDDASCAQAYSNVFDRKLPDGIKSESQFCAGKLNRDTCRGDSGGPLQIIRDKCSHSIIGITSFAVRETCGVVNGMKGNNRVGIYTRVSHYLPWIESIIR